MPGAVTIEEVYGAGGNSGATYNKDYVVLHNTTNADIDISQWTLSYFSSAGGAGTPATALPAGSSIKAGGYFLITEASGANGAALPAADASGSLNFSGTAGGSSSPTPPGR